MAGSFRRRLLAIAGLTVLACGAAILAILFLARMTQAQRTEHAVENVAREVELLQSVLASVPPNERPRHQPHVGELQSGYVASVEDPEEGKFVAEVLAKTSKPRDLVPLEDAAGNPVIAAVRPVAGGGYVFARQPIVAGRETRALRVVVLVLALLSFGLVVASLRTLGAVERDVSTLRASLAALAKDLRSTVERPVLRELDEVATGVAALAKDLDGAQKERERLTRELGDRERLAALGRIAAGIAHEVRNPLAAMKLRADLARTGGEATPAVAKDLDDIASEITRLDRLVSDLLVLAGRRAGPRAEIDVAALVAKRISLLAPWAAEKGVVLASEGKALARVDADAIARAVDNLLRNAIEASPRGARVDARVAVSDDGAMVEVTDAGPGVPAARATELFEPFFTTKPDGTGLGLALARAVASAHRGTVTYDRDGDATRFTLTIGS